VAPDPTERGFKDEIVGAAELALSLSNKPDANLHLSRFTETRYKIFLRRLSC
jgi:hypothetical protein